MFGRWGPLMKGLCAASIVVHFHTFVAGVGSVHGSSMLPTLGGKNEKIIFEYLSARKKGYHVGDIVLSIDPEDPRSSIIKRVRAVEGEIVITKTRSDEKSKVITIPKSHVWLEGDNELSSHDSRDFGAIPVNLIEGTPFFRVWPLKSFGRIRGDSEYYKTHPNHSDAMKPSEYYKWKVKQKYQIEDGKMDEDEFSLVEYLYETKKNSDLLLEPKKTDSLEQDSSQRNDV